MSPGASTRRDSFVGRETELSVLLDGLDQAVEAAGQGFLVVGEAGIGKTRLASEVAAHARAMGAATAWGRCWEAGGAPAYWPWLEVLQALGLGSLLPQRHRSRPDDRFEVFQRVAGALRRAADERPLLLVFDDLHAADMPSLLLLESFLGSPIRGSRVVVLALSRDQDVSDSETEAALLRMRRLSKLVRLGGLDRHEVSALFEATTGAAPPEGLVGLLHEKTEGNPFFVEELSRLVGAGAAADAFGALPAGVRRTVSQRFQPLPAGTRRLLTAGAVVGREFDLEVVAEVLDTTPQEAATDFEPAASAGIVTATPAGRYRFGHILVRDVLYEDLPVVDRARLHAQVAHALARRHHGDDTLDQLAFHFLAAVPAGEGPNALRALMRAAQNAERRLAYEAAARHYDRARELAAAPDIRERETLCDALIGLGRNRERSGHTAAAREAFVEALRIARRLGDAERMAVAALGHAERVKFQQRDGSAAAAWLKEALEMLAPDAVALRARVLAALARVAVYDGGHGRDEVATVIAEAVSSARDAGDPRVLAEALLARQVALWNPDHLEERTANARELLSLAEAADDPITALEGHMALLICALEAGDGRELDRSLSAYGRLAADVSQPRFEFAARARAAMRALMRGELEEGLALAEAARQLGVDTGEPDATPVHRGLLAFVAGDVDLNIDVEAFFVEFSARHTSVGSRALTAMFATRRGHLDATGADLVALLDVIPSLPKDMDWLLCVAAAAEAAHGVDDKAAAQSLYALLLPYESRCVVVAGGIAFGGSVAHYLGLAASTAGWAADAAKHFAVAEAVHRRLDALPWLARTLLEHGRALLPVDADAGRDKLAEARAMAEGLGLSRMLRQFPAAEVGGAAESPRASTVVLRRHGRYWIVGPAAAPFRLPDSRGLQYLAQLLRRPGAEVHVLELAAGVDGARLMADAGPVLDGAAKVAYRRRLADLAEDLEEAERWSDSERAARVRAEIDAVTGELTAAVGLHGRDRRAASPGDRARVSVRKAIARAIEAVDERDADLGRYLSTTVRTGTFCSYVPDHRFDLCWEL